MVTTPTLGPIYAHRGERIDIDKPGRMGGIGGQIIIEQHITMVDPLSGRVTRRLIERTAADGLATGRIKVPTKNLVDRVA